MPTPSAIDRFGGGIPGKTTDVALVRSDTISALGRGAHDLGLAALIGGNAFARVGMHPALSVIQDPQERGRVANAAWRRYGTVNSLALVAIVGGWVGARLDEASPSMLSARERPLAAAKDGAVIAVAVTGIVAAVGGVRFGSLERDGAVPLDDGDHVAFEATDEERRTKDFLRYVGAAHLASAIVLALVNAALGQSNFRRPPVRRLLRSRY